MKYTFKSALATKRGILSLTSSVFWSVWTYCISFDWDEMDHTTTLKKKNWLGPIVTFRSYKRLAKMDRKSTRHTKHHFRLMVRINGHWHWITHFCRCAKNSIMSHVTSDLSLTTNQNVVLLCQNPSLCLSIRNQNRFDNLNYKLPWLHHV